MTTYFIPMCDFPEQRAREGIVNPEYTRADIVHMIRTGELEKILFIHEVTTDQGYPICIRDVTEELIAQADIPEPVEIRDPFRAQRMRRLAGVA